MEECNHSFGLRLVKSLQHLLRSNVKSFRVMESSFVYEDDLSSPIADFKFIVFTKGLFVRCMVLIAVFPVDSACNFEGSVDTLFLSLDSLGGHCLADVLPSRTRASRSCHIQGVPTFVDRPCAFWIAIVLWTTCNYDIYCVCHKVLGTELLFIVIGRVVVPFYLVIRHSHELAWSCGLEWNFVITFLCLNYMQLLRFIWL